MCRCATVNGIMLQHIDWREDALIIHIPQAKADQAGEALSKDKHLYANPLKPEICSVLSLAIYVWCTNREDNNRQQLFLGTAGDSRFSKILQTVIGLIPEDINLGANKKDIGTHSASKGSSTYVLAAPTVSAPQVYLRAGWSLGNVQDRYLFAGAGADQLVGRVVSGLNIYDEEFSTLPPHFSMEDLDFFAFPSTTVATMWPLWYFGNRELRVQPYKKLADGNNRDLKTHVEKVNLSRAKTVMSALERIALEKGLVHGNPSQRISSMTLVEAHNLLNSIYDDFIKSIYDEVHLR